MEESILYVGSHFRIVDKAIDGLSAFNRCRDLVEEFAITTNDVDLGDARMVMKKNGKPVSYGAGVACLGHPLNAALWLARTCAAFGDNLKAGDVILTGALGPMVAIDEGDFVEADISGIGAVSLSISSE